MAITPERKAELLAMLEEVMGLMPAPKPKPKVVTSEAGIVRDADVRVSSTDPNYPGSDEGLVKVRRKDWVTVRVDLWEEQQRPAARRSPEKKGVRPVSIGPLGLNR